MSKKILKMILMIVVSFAMAFALVWVSGVGILFEDTAPLEALMTFSGIIGVVIISVLLITTELEKRISDLQKKNIELNKEIAELKENIREINKKL